MICCNKRVQDLAVVGDAADERADLVAIVVTHAQRVQLADELRAKLESELDADLVRQQPLDPVHDAEQNARGRQRQHDEQERRHQRCGIGRHLTAGQDPVDEILLKLRRRKLHGHADQHHQAHPQRRRPLRPQQGPEPCRRSPSAAGSAGMIRRPPPAADRTAGNGSCLAASSGWTVTVARLAQVFQLVGQQVEPRRQRIRVPCDIDPGVVDIRLEKARADRALRAEFLHASERQVIDQPGFGAVGDNGQVIARDDDPVSAQLA